MAKKREKVPPDLADKVMYESDRICCVCRDKDKDVIIHHVDGDPSNSTRANLAVLCLQDHNDAHSRNAFARNLGPGLIRLYDVSWREIVKLHNEPQLSEEGDREYQIEVLLDLSLAPHMWKNHYLSLNPAAIEASEESSGDIWDAISKSVNHEYSEQEWERFRPLFARSIPEVISRIDRLIMLHSEAIPTELKIEAIRTTRQLEVERSAYLMTPALTKRAENPDLFFTYRFTEMGKVLGRFSRAVDEFRHLMMSDA